ncbi:low-density lipoprotein receptor-related protein 6-like [Ptychodera flava]|uniref:low-density lipoprotein receptor-related protein 6-like n=1 Tax=Ptychodera flava TaxID=63121 RepID=UPI003969BD52
MPVGKTDNVETFAVHPRLILADHAIGLASSIRYINGTGQQIYNELEETNRITRTVLTEDFGKEFISLAFDYADSRIFYSDATDKVIICETLDGSDPSQWVMYSGTSAAVEGVTVDWLANNTYWTDAVYKWIKVSNVDGTFHRSLITTDLDHPAGIACNPSSGYLYWSDIGKMKKIERSTLAGEDRTLILDENSYGPHIIGIPICLTIDHSDNILYWLDSDYSYVMSLDLKNENAKPVELAWFDSEELFSLDIDPEFGFFITDRQDNYLHIVPSDVRQPMHSRRLYNVPNGVIFYSDVNQPNQNAPCDNAGCSQLCVSDPADYKCLCINGYQLQADKETCELDNSVLYDHVMIFSMEGDGLCTFPPNVAHQLTPQHWCFSNAEPEELDVDVYALYVFTIVRAGDVTEIGRMRLETTESWDNIIQLPSSDVRGLAVDWVASNLYITDAERHEIVISSLDGSYVTTLVDSDISRPTAVVVHAPKQYVFWSDTGAHPRIERSDLSGRRERRVLVNTDIESPTHLVIDMRNDRIYWADGETLYIESMEFDGQGRDVFYNYSGLVDGQNFHFTGLAIFQDLLYATEVGNILRVFEIPNKSLIKNIEYPGEMKTMKFFHESLQPISQGPCDVSNGGCDEICINTKYGAECVCSRPSCTPVFRCPLTISNGKLVSLCDNRNGHSCDFSCNSNYIRATNDSVTCTELGEWSISSQDLCRLPPRCPLDIPNGQMSDSCDNKLGESCNYTCNGWYRPFTIDSITCGDEGQWSTPSQELCRVSTGAVIGVSLVVVVLIIVAVVLLVLFRRKIFTHHACRDSDAPGNQSDENAHTGVPSAPQASVQGAYQQTHRNPVELKVQHIEGPQRVKWNSGVVQMAASVDSYDYIRAPPDHHTYDLLPATAKDGDYHTPAEIFADGIENEGRDEADSNGIGAYASMKSLEADCDYIMPVYQLKGDAGEEKLQPASVKIVSSSVNDNNNYAMM